MMQNRHHELIAIVSVVVISVAVNVVVVANNVTVIKAVVVVIGSRPKKRKNKWKLKKNLDSPIKSRVRTRSRFGGLPIDYTDH